MDQETQRKLYAGRFAWDVMVSFVNEMRMAGNIYSGVYLAALSAVEHIEIYPENLSDAQKIEIAEFAIEALHDCVSYSDDGVMHDIHDMLLKQVGVVQTMLDGETPGLLYPEPA